MTFVKYGGSGLGLRISKDLAELMGGKYVISLVWYLRAVGSIQLSSEGAGFGSTCTFNVLCSQASSEALAGYNKALSSENLVSKGEEKTSSDLPQVDLSPRREKNILIVEDNPINQKVKKFQRDFPH